MTFMQIIGIEVALFLVTAISIRVSWGAYTGYLNFKLRELQSYNILSRVWPDDQGFASLHYSAARHLLYGLLSCAAIWYVNKGWLNTTLLAVGAMYALFSLLRYAARAKDYKASCDCGSFLKPVKRACFAVTAFAICTQVVIYLAYTFRP